MGAELFICAFASAAAFASATAFALASAFASATAFASAAVFALSASAAALSALSAFAFANSAAALSALSAAAGAAAFGAAGAAGAAAALSAFAFASASAFANSAAALSAFASATAASNADFISLHSRKCASKSPFEISIALYRLIKSFMAAEYVWFKSFINQLISSIIDFSFLLNDKFFMIVAFNVGIISINRLLTICVVVSVVIYLYF